MDLDFIAKKLEGLQTISAIANTLKINKRTAINYVSELRKKGLVKTEYGKRKIRLYRISTIKRKEVGYPSIYDIINQNSRIKIVTNYKHISYKKLCIEEVIVEAVKTKSFRVILASLELFNKVRDWSKLYKLAKKEQIGRKIGALYDLTRKFIKIRKIDKRTRNALLRSKVKDKYIIKKIKSKDFKNIEKIWGIYLPFNKADMRDYKE